MNFKDFQYSIGRLTTDVRSQLARNNPLQNQDTKALSMWIFNERNNLATMRTLAYQQSETIKVFQQWTKEELMNDKEEDGRDIEDIGDKLVKLLEKQTEIEQQYAAKYQQYRHAIKSIRNRETKLADVREKKRTLSSRIANLTKTSPKSPKLRELQKELATLDRDTHDTEMEMGDFKRFALKEAFYLRFNAMNEYAEKMAMIAGFGKYVVDLLDIAPTPATEPTRRPYDKGKEAAMIFADAINAVENWQPQAGDERPTIATNTSKFQGTTVTDDQPTDESTEMNDNSKTTDGEKGKQAMGTTAQSHDEQETAPIPADTPTSAGSITPPRLPPRSPLPSHESTTSPTTPSAYTADAIASVTSDHKPPPPAATDAAAQRQETEDDLDQLDLYDAPPPTYDETTSLANQKQQDENATPRNSDEPTAVVQDAKQPIPDIQEPPTPSLPPAPAFSHARPITHEDKEQVVGDNERSSTMASATPSSIQYQQSPLPIHQSSSPQSQYSYHPPHHHSSTMASTIHSHNTSMNWNVAPPGIYSGVEPNYHQGQYQQLYEQLTERQQHGPTQRPYSEFQQQYMRPAHQDAGGFRIPDLSSSSSTPPPSAEQQQQQQQSSPSPAVHLSADEEKRRLAERYAMEETQARKASIQEQQQQQQQKAPSPGLGSTSSSSSAHKKSVITPEGENHGYKSSRRK
ncbi:unnamed protein product [Absidia cylindrospora]